MPAASKAKRSARSRPLSAPLGTRWSAHWRFVSAIGLAVLVLLAELALPHPPIAPFVLVYPAVVLAAWLGGRWPGLLSVLITAALANFAFMAPTWAWSTSTSALWATAVYLAGGTAVALLCASFRQKASSLHAQRGAYERLSSRLGSALEELRASEARFRHLADALPQVVWTAEPDGKVDYYNERVNELSGARHLEDGSWEWEAVLHPDDLGPTLEAWSRAIRTGETYEIAHRVRRADGELHWFLSRGVPVRDASGRVIKWFGTATDIHAQKAAEEALRDADRRKDEFLAVLSHELRNPLAPILNSVHVLERAAPGGEQAKRAREVIERQARHMARLVDDLLDVTRISRGKISLQRERLDLLALVRSTADDHRDVFRRAGVELVVHADVQPADLLQVDGDRVRLAQAIGNLLTNAVKFTPRGGKTELFVDAVPDEQVRVRVRDTGAGMAEATLERLFEPFMQADQTLDRSRGGLGLGLALVKGLVEMHGGRVSARSEGLGRGSELELTLPRAEPANSELQRPDAEEDRPLPKRVLVIEDNPDAADSLREALELDEHEVAVAYSGDDGIEAARAFQPDVVLCDIGLPGLDGYDVARALRADGALRSTYLVALSGYAQQEDVQRAREAGFDRHMAKPPGIADLMRLLAEAPARAARTSWA